VITLAEYSEISLAQHYKKCEEQEMLRVIQAAIINFGGMGVKKPVSPQQVMPIPLLDSANITLPISTIEGALKLLKEFEDLAKSLKVN